MKLKQIKGRLKKVKLADYQTHSRVHTLRAFDIPGVACFIKREDELSFGISGSKIRKYLSLIPHILEQKPDEVIVLGTPYSNHVLGISQLLRENGIYPILFLAASKQEANGNFLLTSLFVEKENIYWFEKGSWDLLETHAETYIKKNAEKKVLIIPKGANCKEALPGLLTLPLDIERNEEKLGKVFDHIFMDSGTGLAAAIVLLAFSLLRKDTHLHIMHLTGDEKEFYTTLERAKEEFEEFMQEKLPSLIPYTIHMPRNAKSFGSVNNTVMTTVKEIAKTEGFFIDPIYNAKLFYEGKEILKELNLKGNVLFIHSGGGLSLTGFLSKLT